MNIYKLKSPISTTALIDIRAYLLLTSYEKSKSYNSNNFRYIHTFLTLAFTRFDSLKQDPCGHGDKCFNLLFLSSLPSFTSETPELILTLIHGSEDNKREYFLISKLDLTKIYPDLIQLKEYKTISQNELFDRIQHFYEYVDFIFEQSFNAVENKLEEKDKKQPEDITKDIKEDKFNLNNYESI